MSEQFSTATRVFPYTYIYFDAFFLAIWILILLIKKEYRAIIFGLIIAPIIYLIDAVIWWNSSAGAGFSVGVMIREYWIGGVQLSHPLGHFVWMKFGADFMMTISYALYTFPWLYIAFRNLRMNKLFSKDFIRYTMLWFGFWLLVPWLSIHLNFNNTQVIAVRHMDSQLPFWIANVIIGYLVLVTVYKNNLSKVWYIFLVGVIGALVMELPLYIFKIRPAGLWFVLFEGLILLNQGTPWLFLFVDKIIPYFANRSGRILQAT